MDNILLMNEVKPLSKGLYYQYSNRKNNHANLINSNQCGSIGNNILLRLVEKKNHFFSQKSLIRKIIISYGQILKCFFFIL